jgi:hypothetical protein
MAGLIGNQRSIGFRELSVVEHQQEFAALRLEPLNRVRNTCGEEPEIIFGDVVDKSFAIQVDARDPRVAAQHDRPFAGVVPMQFPAASSG